MDAPTTLPALLASLTQSLSLTHESASKLAFIDKPKDGISLLDVKNELLLSYLQNLVFIILLKLRNSKSTSADAAQGVGELGGLGGLDAPVRAKLVQLRLYLERGARPLEEKLKFSIERFLRTAEDAQREEQSKKQGRKENSSKGTESDDLEASSDDEDGDEDEGPSGQGRPTQQRPGRPSAAPRFGTLIDDVTAKTADHEDGPPGIYRPPKRDRVVMETTRPREKADRKPQRSHTMEEFVQSEFSTAPVAEPSIGTTIVQGGRKMKTVQDRKDEAERREYEEMNLVRLPKLGKKDRAKKNKAVGRGHMQFGGEEWRDLGEGVDRIDRLTKRKGPAGGGVRALLEKSRKRGFDTTDGPRSSGHGAEIGERFQKKVKMLEAGRRDRGKR
ncbi:hypothetical protein G6O67_005373 [Ophiocordyceps sinensis]|uniref:Sas10/Utp3/C1D-like protein n=1 Tax=Ophiocordyceps sinensis TaxID=72228 RepID=A0A8H4PRF7_9HYPO|nr:hypothetical protein G6O67_005373 [Ophiocordyceps sinensis]